MTSGVDLNGIRVELIGDEIVVSRPRTVFLVAFRKHPYHSHLIVTRNWLSAFDSKPLAEFRALAASLAHEKAYSLGWRIEADKQKQARTGRAKLALVRKESPRESG
jgi:hypothetical protein